MESIHRSHLHSRNQSARVSACRKQIEGIWKRESGKSAPTCTASPQWWRFAFAAAACRFTACSVPARRFTMRLLHLPVEDEAGAVVTRLEDALGRAAEVATEA